MIPPRQSRHRCSGTAVAEPAAHDHQVACYPHRYRLHSTTSSITSGSTVYRHTISVHQKCGRHTLPANSSEMTVIHSASTNRMYEMPT